MANPRLSPASRTFLSRVARSASDHGREVDTVKADHIDCGKPLEWL